MSDENEAGLTADPPQGQNVEDVLAAIRRLVTEEEAQRRRMPPLPQAAALVLTRDMLLEDEPEPAAAEPEAPLLLDPALFADTPPAPAPERRTLARPEMPPATAEAAPAAPKPPAAPEVEALIRGIVREELQAALGEPLPPGLKKLVRREIARALGQRPV